MLRAKIVLAASGGESNTAIAERLGTTWQTVVLGVEEKVDGCRVAALMENGDRLRQDQFCRVTQLAHGDDYGRGHPRVEPEPGQVMLHAGSTLRHRLLRSVLKCVVDTASTLEACRDRYKPIIPEGHHLGTSHEVEGAVTGHLFEDGTDEL